MFSLNVGAGGVDTYNKLMDMQGGSDDFASAIEELYGSHAWFGLGAESAFTMPMLGFAVYDHGDALIQVDNPVSPQIYTSDGERLWLR
ncbi:MAG: hypothetical protein HC902_10895 [Calothrix sp. SM1_5_4]|nr:hypothetical protein [Calothrix sp. SM1_5_4]